MEEDQRQKDVQEIKIVVSPQYAYTNSDIYILDERIGEMDDIADSKDHRKRFEHVSRPSPQ